MEGAAGFFGASSTAVWAGLVAGAAGWAGAFFGAIAGAVLPIIQRKSAQDHFFGTIYPTLMQYGLTGGPEEDGDFQDGPWPKRSECTKGSCLPRTVIWRVYQAKELFAISCCTCYARAHA